MRTIPELRYSLNLAISIQQSQNSIPAAAKTDKLFPEKPY
jgi:hypothetical protein